MSLHAAKCPPISLTKNRPHDGSMEGKTGFLRLPKSAIGWLPRLTKAEILAYIFILDKTIGYGKAEDAIPRSQFMAYLGMSPRQASRSISKLESFRLVRVRRRSKQVSTYEPLTPCRYSASLEIKMLENNQPDSGGWEPGYGPDGISQDPSSELFWD